METDTINLSISKKALDDSAKKIGDFYLQETGVKYPLPFIRESIHTWIELHLDSVAESIEELLTTPNLPEAQEFRRQLDLAIAAAPSIAAESVPTSVPTAAEASIFNGNRQLSVEKLGAMAAYISSKGASIYKTQLNKLLFYSDFVNYYLHGRSISGMTYVHLPYGPVPDNYEHHLKALSESGAIEIVKGQTFELIRNGSEAGIESLDVDETKTLDWVLENFGRLSASEISNFSHREKAYRFTRPGEPIAYEYAKFFEKLPIKDHHR